MLALFLTLGACVKTQSVRVQNSTDADLVMRLSVDHYMDAYECRGNTHVSAFNREGMFTIEPGDAICLVSEVPKGDKEFDIRERVRNLTVVREGNRCLYMTTDALLPLYEERGGRQTLDVRNSLCPRAQAAPPSRGSAAPPPADSEPRQPTEPHRTDENKEEPLPPVPR